MERLSNCPQETVNLGLQKRRLSCIFSSDPSDDSYASDTSDASDISDTSASSIFGVDHVFDDYDKWQGAWHSPQDTEDENDLTKCISSLFERRPTFIRDKERCAVPMGGKISDAKWTLQQKHDAIGQDLFDDESSSCSCDEPPSAIARYFNNYAPCDESFPPLTTRDTLGYLQDRQNDDLENDDVQLIWGSRVLSTPVVPDDDTCSPRWPTKLLTPEQAFIESPYYRLDYSTVEGVAQPSHGDFWEDVKDFVSLTPRSVHNSRSHCPRESNQETFEANSDPESIHENVIQIASDGVLEDTWHRHRMDIFEHERQQWRGTTMKRRSLSW